MSGSINVNYGTASVTLHPDNGMFSGSFGEYKPADLVHAAVMALRAIGTEEADDAAQSLAGLLTTGVIR